MLALADLLKRERDELERERGDVDEDENRGGGYRVSGYRIGERRRNGGFRKPRELHVGC